MTGQFPSFQIFIIECLSFFCFSWRHFCSFLISTFFFAICDFNPLLFTYRSTQLKNFFSWGKFSYTWNFTKTALKNCWCQHFSRKWWVYMDPVNNMAGKKFHKYLFVGIKSWGNEMSFKCKVFWINSKLSEARKVNFFILKIKLFSNTKCWKNALLDKLLVS